MAGDQGEIRAYRMSDGALAWRDSLQGFSPWAQEVTPSGAGLRRSIAFGQPNHSMQLLRPVSDDVVLAQARRVHRDERIDSWLIDVRTGRNLWFTEQLPRLPIVSPTRALIIQDVPHPTAALAEVRFTTR
jgi:hypothetical protein